MANSESLSTDSPRLHATEEASERRVRRASMTPAAVTVIGGEATKRKPDIVSTEEPLEIRVGGETVAVTMRTPGHDFELAVGYLFTEGIVTGLSDVREVRYCTKELNAPQEYNIVTVDLRHEVDVTLFRRATVTSSSCGLCGTDSIEHLATNTTALRLDDGPRLSTDEVLMLPATLRTKQPQFSKTGGLHGVGLFRDGKAIVVREDVGRHNALDKVIGSRLLATTTQPNLTLSDQVLVVSGRVSFEIVQKAAMARLAWIVAVGAPTSLAIDAANELGITLVGFVNGNSANVYTHTQRVTT